MLESNSDRESLSTNSPESSSGSSTALRSAGEQKLFRWGCCFGQLYKKCWIDNDSDENTNDPRPGLLSDTSSDETSSFGLRRARVSVEVNSERDHKTRVRKDSDVVITTNEPSSDEEEEGTEMVQRHDSRRSRGVERLRQFNSGPVFSPESRNRAERDNNSFETIWQVFMMDRWLTYEPSIGQELEMLYRYISPEEAEFLGEKYKTNWWCDDSLGNMLAFDYKNYKICPLLMVQKNMIDGRESRIRRQQIESDKVSLVENFTPRRRTLSSQQPIRNVQLRRNVKEPRNQRSNTSFTLGQPGPFRKVRSLNDLDENNLLSDDVNIAIRSSKLRGGFLMSSSDETSASEGDDVNFEMFRDWNGAQVIRWLHMLKLEDYADIFKEKNVTGKELARAKLTYFIIELGLPVEQSIQISSALKVLKSGFIKVLGGTESFDSAGLFKSIATSATNDDGVRRQNLYPLYEQGESPYSASPAGCWENKVGEKSRDSTGVVPQPNGLSSPNPSRPPPFMLERPPSRRTAATHRSHSKTGQLGQHIKYPTYYSHSGYPLFQTTEDDGSTPYPDYPEGNWSRNSRDWLPMQEHKEYEDVSIAEEEESYPFYNAPNGENDILRSSSTSREGRRSREASSAHERKNTRGISLGDAFETLHRVQNPPISDVSAADHITKAVGAYHSRRVSTRSQRNSAWFELMGCSQSPLNTCDERDEKTGESGSNRERFTLDFEPTTISRATNSSIAHGRNRDSIDNTSYTTIIRDKEWRKDCSSESEREDIEMWMGHHKGLRRRSRDLNQLLPR